MSNNNELESKLFEGTAATQGASTHTPPGIIPLEELGGPLRVQDPAAAEPQTPTVPEVEGLTVDLKADTTPPVTFGVDDDAPIQPIDEETPATGEDIFNQVMQALDIKPTDKESSPDELINQKAMKVNIALGDRESLLQKATVAGSKLTTKEQFQAELNDVDSVLSRLEQADRNHTQQRELMFDSFKRACDALPEGTDPATVFRRAFEHIGDGASRHVPSGTTSGPVDLVGNSALVTFTTLTSGMYRVVLWNSGIHVTLRPPSMQVLHDYYVTAATKAYEYGKQFGAHYYMFADLTIRQHIVESMLPYVIHASNYKFWRDTNKFMSAISYQDFDTLLWAIAATMHPEGTDVAFTCGNRDCHHQDVQHIDVRKLRVINTSLLFTPIMDYWRKTTSSTVGDEQIAEYRKLLGFTKKAELTIDVADSGFGNTQWSTELKVPEIMDFMTVADDFNTELIDKVHVTNQLDVNGYLKYNFYRVFIPWISSINGSVPDTGEQFIIRNVPENAAAYKLAMDSYLMENTDLAETVKGFIMDSKISHIVYKYTECPHCHKPAENAYHGYVPFDVMRVFFTLALQKLVRSA